MLRLKTRLEFEIDLALVIAIITLVIEIFR
jgi:hypothetical protein